MLFDARRAMWATIATGGLAALWIAVYVLFNAPLRAAIGDAAHASAFLSLTIAAASVFVALMFRRLALIRDGLGRQAALARWRVERGEWERFARAVAPQVASGMRATLAMIVVFAIAIPAALALAGYDASVLFWIALAIIGVGLTGYGLGRRHARAVYRYRDGAVALGRQGIVVNGAFHGWGVRGSRLVSAELDDGASPARLTLRYAFPTRAGEQVETVYAPAPAAALTSVRAALARLRAGDDAAPDSPSSETV
ncbi:MAG: hypothetical protein JNK46_07470 [Methylobacteriaceae bacterium]|nr:hypothetical protein [Methylobacteriaceae bacterium]